MNLLIIEDCTIIANAYRNILNEIPNINFNISFAKNCDEAIQYIEHKKAKIVLLDLQLPASRNEHFISGEDLGLLIRKVSPDTKIIVLTNVSDSLRINNIVKSMNPEGFAIKSDTDPIDLKNAIADILKGKKYYSKTIKGYTNKTSINGITMDDYDRQILYYLSMGEKTKNLSKYIPLSTRALEVRKTKLKMLLDKDNKSDFNLVKEAKNRGVI